MNPVTPYHNPTRRSILGAGLWASLGWLAPAGTSRADPAPPRIPKNLFGNLPYSFGTRIKREPAFGEPMNFLPHCAKIGFAGAQMSLGKISIDQAEQLRAAAETRGLFIEGILSPPREETDVARFDAELAVIKAAGGSVARLAMLGGRRYEQLHSLEEYGQFTDRAGRQFQWMEPPARKHGVRLAIENHKDYRSDELAAVMRRLGSEFVGVCLDFGNNIALLEDPWKVIDTLAPYALTSHLKDMAVEESAEGFTLAEVPLGQGVLDLPRIIARIHAANPAARFNLEMITRDPLRIPCLTDGYWSTFGAVPSRLDIDRMLGDVKKNARPAGSLPRLSRMTPAEQIEHEHRNVVQSVAHAQQHLFTQ